MRIVGGRFRGRSLTSPTSERVRPTSDRLRESLFNILEHNYGGVAGLKVVDLFAGTGALAFEAVSRGAASALLVDDGAEARAAMRANIEALGVGGITRIFRRDACKLGVAPLGELFSLAFLDPPYGKGLAERTLAALRDGKWLETGALAIVEDAAAAPWTLPAGYVSEETRIFGDTKVVFLRTALVELASHKF